MILLGSLIVLLLLVFACNFSGGGFIEALVDVPALLCLLFPLVGYVLICGYKPFCTGLSAILHRPAQSQTDVSDYFMKLTACVLAFGACVPLILSIFCLCPLGNLEIRKQMLTTAMLLFFYSGWLTLLFSVPIAYRFSGGTIGNKLWRFLVGPAVVGFCLFINSFTGGCLLWLQVQPIDVLRQISGCIDLKNLLNVLAFFGDMPSLVAVVGTITACRLGMGKLQNRYDWIPLCVLIGVLWSLLGMTIMLTDLDSKFFLIGYLVSSIAILYACIGVLAILVNRAWFFTACGAILAICFIVFMIISEGPTFFKELGAVITIAVIALPVFCVKGRFCDIFYLSVTRYESFGDLFRKHKIEWCVLAAPPLVFLTLGVLFLPSIQYSREASRCKVCVKNMKQIGIALQNYHDHHGSFPPAYTVDAEGNPLHSWRTLILPYFATDVLEPKWKEIYDQIRFDEPWNSEHNIQFNKYSVQYNGHASEEEFRQYHTNSESDSTYHHNMPAVYGCPNNYGSGSEVVETVYKMVVGDNAIGNVQGTSKSQIKRPLDKTVLVVESGLSVPWMSPSDFAVEDFKTAVYGQGNSRDEEKLREIREARYDCSPNAADLVKIPILGGWHGRELHILFADGTVKTYWDGKLPLSEVEAMSRVRE